MSERERVLARRVSDLQVALAAAEQRTASVRAGYGARLQVASADLARAHDEIHLMRGQRDVALAGKAEAQQHVGAVYRRVRQVGELVAAWEGRLPAPFVAEVRGLVEPDFAELLGVAV